MKSILILLLLAPLATLHAAANGAEPTSGPPSIKGAALPSTASGSKVDHVWVVFKTHFDLGYSLVAERVFYKYRVTMMDGALQAFEQNRNEPPESRFVWTVPGWPLARAIIDRETNSQRRARIEAAIREGALAVHALPCTIYTESFELEDLVRSLGFSSRLARDYGRPLPIAAKMTDVPEHNWTLVTVLAHAGVKFLDLGCNPASQFPRVPKLFWWEGPDGSRVLCAYHSDYGSGLIPPNDWPSRNYLAMQMTGDNHGPPTPKEIAKAKATLATKLPGVRFTFGTLDDFVAAVLAEKPDLPVVRGDMPDTWIHGLMSMADATRIARTIRPLEPALDSLDTHLNLYGLKTEPVAATLAAAYENSLLYAEHTWGLNGGASGNKFWPLEGWKTKCHPDNQRTMLRSFEDHRNYIRKTQSLVEDGLKSRLELLARSVAVEGRRIVVWNSLLWPRSGMIEVEGSSFYAENIPANGYKTFVNPALHPAKPADNALPDSLQTPFYKVKFDLKRGGIESLVEKRSGQELVDQSSPYAIGQFLHEKFSQKEVDRFFKVYSRMQGGWALGDFGKPGMPATTYQALTPSKWTATFSTSADADKVTLTAGDTKGLAKAYAMTFTFSRYEPSVEVEWRVTDKTADKMPEGGWLCFPFAVANPTYTLGRLGAPVDVAKDIIPGANRHLFAVTTGVQITGDGDTGVCLCPIDSPLVSLGKPGLWWWSLDYVPEKPTVFVNLYNNMWNTNFPLWQDGSWVERVRFWPGRDLLKPAWQNRLPLLAAAADGPAGKLPREQEGLTVSAPGVLVTAFGGNPDGAGTLLRLWEQRGVTGDVTVKLPGNFHHATPVDLRGVTAGGPVEITGNELKTNLRAYAPSSWILE